MSIVGKNGSYIEDDTLERVLEMFRKSDEEFKKKMEKKKIPKPLYEYGDWVKFKIKMFEDTAEKEYTGQVAIVDRYGTFEQNEEPSYDIYVPEENCLFKHFRQSHVEFVKKGDGTCSIDTPMHKSGE